jgi:hypothetical protein
MQLSTTLLETGDYDMALKALEYAAELFGLLPNFSQAATLGIQIHGSSKAICDKSGDVLSRTLVEFRYCDFVNTFTSNLAEAIERRNELLSAPVCTNGTYRAAQLEAQSKDGPFGYFPLFIPRKSLWEGLPQRGPQRP